MGEWIALDTNTHQDHVIAHVVGASVLAHFVWDETAYLLLDIGFIWNVYLDGEMGLVPQVQAIAELDADDKVRAALRDDMDEIARGEVDGLRRMHMTTSGSPIVEVELLRHDNSRRVQLSCEDSMIVIETSLETAEVKIYER